MAHFINVLLPLPLDKHFTYSVSLDEAHFLNPGMRVAVPFGKTKLYTGIVVKIHQEAPQLYKAKPIAQILDETPIVTLLQLQFWEWMAKYYQCSEGNILRAALPAAFLLESETVVYLLKEIEVTEKLLSDDELLLFEALQRQSGIKIQEIVQLLDKKKVLPVINSLVEKNIATINQEIHKRYKPKLERYIKLHSDYDQEKDLEVLLKSLDRAPKQRSILLSLFSLAAKSKKPVSISALKKGAKASASSIKSLMEKGILEEFQLKSDRVQGKKEKEGAGFNLNEVQQQTLTGIHEVLEVKNVCLLHGITSSGKTEIYMKLIEEVIKAEKQVLFLLPEIALTTQLIFRLQNYFGEKVTVYHSKYSGNERVEVYQKVLEKNDGAQIIVGVRSSIFLPFRDLGLVVVDEEHETTFKQFDPAPRYHARDAAIVLAGLYGAKVLLGSATPAIETYFNATHQKYGLVELNRRYGNVQPPEIEIVDLQEKHRKKKMKGHFSDRLLEEIQATLDSGKQVILFQNRRGYSPILECNTCGHSPQCPNCDVSLTYHHHNNQLRCHYCGYHIAMQQKCMACGSHELSTKGFGTEQIESELHVLFPSHKIGRMDVDTTRGKHGYEKIISSFENLEIDILVGTQMLSKGLDFRNVQLAGIMNADSLLNFPDFRAHEKSFQLMMQVSGRAGRTKERGKVLIQTFNPHHRIVQQVSENNYADMYQEQLEQRRQYKYPPFCRLIRITVKSRDYSRANEAADWLAKSLKNIFKNNILGPEFPPVARIRNEYYKNILIKIPQNQSLGKTKTAITKILSSFKAIGVYRSVKTIVNVDPY